MKNTLLVIAFAVASVPMFAAQTPAPATPQSSTPAPATKPAVKAKTHHKKAAKKTAPKTTTTTPVAK